MDLIMYIIDDDRELDRILESENLDDYEHMDMPMEQPGHLSHKHTRVRMAPTLDTRKYVGAGTP